MSANASVGGCGGTRFVLTSGRQLRHPNIVRLYDSFDEEEFVYIVMELIRGQDAFEVMHAKVWRIAHPPSVLCSCRRLSGEWIMGSACFLSVLRVRAFLSVSGRISRKCCGCGSASAVSFGFWLCLRCK